MNKRTFLPSLLLLVLLFTACEKDQVAVMAIDDQGTELRSDDCFNFKADFKDACIGEVNFVAAGVPYGGLGAVESPGNVGPYQGTFASIILESRQNDNEKGAIHYTLIHKFVDNEGDYFYTDDRAICAPAKGQSITCLINDQMTIVGGTGKFANISGKIKTHGPIVFGDPICEGYFGSLNLTLHGHVCLK